MQSAYPHQHQRPDSETGGKKAFTGTTVMLLRYSLGWKGRDTQAGVLPSFIYQWGESSLLECIIDKLAVHKSTASFHRSEIEGTCGSIKS